MSDQSVEHDTAAKHHKWPRIDVAVLIKPDLDFQAEVPKRHPIGCLVIKEIRWVQ